MAQLPFTSVQDLLRSAERFSRALPGLAGALGGPVSTDAPLERAREGLFFLGAAATDRARELEADGQRALADVIAPDLLRPTPSATVVELVAERAVRRVPAGAEIRSREPSAHRFRTVSETRVGPWRVERTRVERTPGGADALCLDLVSLGPWPLAETLSTRARLFVDGPREVALRLLGHVLSHTSRVELTPEGGAPIALTGPEPYGTRPDQTLAPEPDGPYTGLSVLREYFLLPEKFSFFELGGLVAALRGSPARRATVRLILAEPVPAQVREGANVRAHCTPAVNLFAANAEPWVFEAGRASAAARVAGAAREDTGVYAVLAVSAIEQNNDQATAVALPPVRRFAATGRAQAFPYAFSAKRVTGEACAEPELLVSLTSPRGQPPVLRPHVVSMALLATSRGHASALRPGDLSEPGPGMPPGVRGRNVTPCSPYVTAPSGPELALQVAVRAAVPDGDALFALQSRLFAMVPRHGVDPAAVRSYEARIAAIESVEVATVLGSGGARRGYEARLRIDETPFAGLGDVALFVRVLHAAFECQVSAGHFYQCVATCTKSGTQIRWSTGAP
jgi:type VI secretion system protein ImpG